MSALPAIDRYLPTLDHTVCTVADLALRVPRCSAAISLDGWGWVCDATFFDGGDPPPQAALDWARCYGSDDQSVFGVVLLSGETSVGAVVEAADLRWYEQARWSLAEDGLVLRDWLRFDSRTVRSMAVTSGTASEGWVR